MDYRSQHDPYDPDDDIYDLADAAVDVMRTNPSQTWTASALGRKINVSTYRANDVLDYLVKQQYARTYGNGAWQRVGLR
jgi:hypothetical protein